MQQVRHCPNCGSALSSDLLNGLCQDCLGRLALRTDAEGAFGAFREFQSIRFETESTDFLAELAPPPDAGRRCLGDYTLLDEIGRGGMGTVYRARQRSVNRIVALKIIESAAIFSDERALRRFQLEAATAAMLDHPNIVPLYEVGCEGDYHFFSMKLVEGGSLSSHLQRFHGNWRAIARLIATVARAAHYAHRRGVIHRDLKPGNILIDERDEPFITDFGLAKRVQESSDLTSHAALVGTPHYMAPEQASGVSQEVTVLADVYALGAILYHLVSGRPPFAAGSAIETLRLITETEPPRPSRIGIAVDRDLETICLKCLEKNPAARYSSAQALANDLERWLRYEPIKAQRIGTWRRTFKWIRRQPTLAAMVGSTVAAMVGLVVTLSVANLRIRLAHSATEAAAKENQRRLVRLNVLTGNNLAKEGDAMGAMLWFAEALKLERGDLAREMVLRRRLAALMRDTPQLAHIWFHQTFVNHADFSHDGRRIVSSSMDRTARVWDAESGAAVTPPLRHDDVVWSAAFTPDDACVITASTDGKLRYWNVATGELARPPLATSAVDMDFVAFSPDGRWLAAPVPGGVGLFHANSGEAAEIRFATPSPVLKTRFSPDGRVLAAFGGSPGVHFWEVATGRACFQSIVHTRELKLLDFSPDGSQVAAIVASREVHLQELADGRYAWPPMEPGGDLFDCQFSPQGVFLAIASWDGGERVFDRRTGHPVGPTMRHKGGIRFGRFSPDGRLLATASWDGTARLWDPVTGEPASPVLSHAGSVRTVRFSPDGGRLVTASQDGTVRLWRLDTDGPARLLLRHDGSVRHAQFSPGGRRILTCSWDGTARIWDADSGSLIRLFRHSGHPLVGGMSPHGDRVVTGCDDGSVHIWDVREEVPLVSIHAHGRSVRSLAFSPDGRRLISAGDDGTARVWDAETGNPVTGPLEHRAAVVHAAFSRNGSRVVTASHDGTAQIWDPWSGDRIGGPLAHDCEVYSAAFAPNGVHLVTACCDRSELGRYAQVWDGATLEPLGPPLRHRDGVLWAEFSPDGRFIVTAGEDKAAMIWHAATGQLAAPPLTHTSYVLRALFSPDGHFILTASQDGTARVWEAETGTPITSPLHHPDAVLTAGWSPDGLRVVTGSNDGIARVWDVSVTLTPIEELQTRAEVLSAHRLDARTGAIPLDTEEIRERWERLRRGSSRSSALLK